MDYVSRLVGKGANLKCNYTQSRMHVMDLARDVVAGTQPAHVPKNAIEAGRARDHRTRQPFPF